MADNTALPESAPRQALFAVPSAVSHVTWLLLHHPAHPRRHGAEFPGLSTRLHITAEDSEP